MAVDCFGMFVVDDAKREERKELKKRVTFASDRGGMRGDLVRVLATPALVCRTLDAHTHTAVVFLSPDDVVVDVHIHTHTHRERERGCVCGVSKEEEEGGFSKWPTVRR